MLHRAATCCNALQHTATILVLQDVEIARLKAEIESLCGLPVAQQVCVSHCVGAARYYSVLQCVAVCCNVLQGVAAGCSVLQCVSCSVSLCAVLC